MTNPNDPAFPLIRTGLTKREYFAAMAMIALQASDIRGRFWNQNSDATCSENSVCLADALIAELSKSELAQKQRDATK